MASAIELMARTVALLRKGPATDGAISKAISCTREVVPRHTQMLHREGVIYVSSWITAGGKPQPVWAIQPLDEPMPDAPCRHWEKAESSPKKPREVKTATLIATRPNLRTKWVGRMAEVFKREPQDA
jgi:hypothetical protein